MNHPKQEDYCLDTKKTDNIDLYINAFPSDVQERLRKIRDVVRAAAPDAEEKISYGMPAFAQNGILVYFAAFKNHIGFYPTPSGIAAFSGELSGCKNARGSVQFPLDRPLPLDLIRRIVLFRVRENTAKAAAKRKR